MLFMVKMQTVTTFYITILTPSSESGPRIKGLIGPVAIFVWFLAPYRYKCNSHLTYETRESSS